MGAPVGVCEVRRNTSRVSNTIFNVRKIYVTFAMLRHLAVHLRCVYAVGTLSTGTALSESSVQSGRERA